MTMNPVHIHILKNPNDPQYVSDAIVIRSETPLLTEDLKDLKQKVIDYIAAQNWIGETKYRVAFVYAIMGFKEQFNNWLTMTLPRDDDAMVELLMTFPELKSVKFAKSYDIRKIWAGDAPRPVSRVKKADAKDNQNLNEFGHDMNRIPVRYHYLYQPAVYEEGKRFYDALNGYPFKDKTAKENQNYIEFEIIARLRSRFPFVYGLDQLVGGYLLTALKLLAKPENQGFLSEHWLHCFGGMLRAGRHQSFPESSAKDIISWFALRDKIGEKKMRTYFKKSGVDVEDETVMDPYIARAGGIGRSSPSDRDVIDDLADAEESAMH